MSSSDSHPNVTDEDALAKEIKQLHDAELVDFVRSTVQQLNALADRLEHYVSESPTQGEPE
jgi:hypothetical protein